MTSSTMARWSIAVRRERFEHRAPKVHGSALLLLALCLRDHDHRAVAASVAHERKPYAGVCRLIAIATTGLTRSAFMRNVPTVAESGFPGFNASNWYAFVAPGKTPPPVLARWNRELVKVLSATDVKAQLDKHGLTGAPGTREELAKVIDNESKAWGQLIRERKIKAE
jgi:tripartite-type tricarboxylate transporter receptor subunit TctC